VIHRSLIMVLPSQRRLAEQHWEFPRSARLSPQCSRGMVNGRQNLRGYTATRRYVLENGTHNERAEMLVRIVCQEDGSKQFEVVSSIGWGRSGSMSSQNCWKLRPRLRVLISASNPASRLKTIHFEMAVMETVRGRQEFRCEVLGLSDSGQREAVWE